MGQRRNVMKHYPTGQARKGLRPVITAEDREISRRFGFDYFDGERKYGYGGYNYDPRFWTRTVEHICEIYALAEGARVLDVGCGKGFMLVDLKKLRPDLDVVGVDISEYALAHAHPDVTDWLTLANARSLPFDEDSFDLVISINTVHNLDREECGQALAEIERVGRSHAFVMIDGWTTTEERESLESWVLTARTMMSLDDWQDFFAEVGYTGDFDIWTAR